MSESMVHLAATALALLSGASSHDAGSTAKLTELMSEPGFVENRGQWDRSVRFMARLDRLNIWVTDSGLTYQYLDRKGASIPKQHVVKVDLVKGQKPTAVGVDPQELTANYFVGKDSRKWATGVRRFKSARLNGVYPGIDLVAYFDAKTRLPRYDFVVGKGADPKRIAMRYRGVRGLRQLDSKAIAYRTRFGEVAERDLKAYECDAREDARRTFVPVSRHIDDSGLVSFAVPKYDATKTLVIDPMVWSTYLGGTLFTEVNGVAVNIISNTVYACGETESTDLPFTAGVIQPTNPASSRHVAFVARLTFNGMACTYYGGNSAGSPQTRALAIAFDRTNSLTPGGTVCVVGETNCDDLPSGGTPYQSVPGGRKDGFVVKFKSGLDSILGQTYLGGAYDDAVTGVATDNSGNTYVSGYTQYGTGGNHFPVSIGAPQSTFGGGNNDGFATKLNAALSNVTYSTLLGGTRDEYPYSRGTTAGLRSYPRIAIDASGNAYVAGTTSSPDYPTTSGAYQETGAAASGNRYDAFLTRLNAAGTGVDFSTYVGSGRSEAGGVTIDWNGNPWVAGTTRLSGFPTTPGAFSSRFAAGDGFLSKFSTTGTSLLASTLFGGSGLDVINGICFVVDGSVAVAGGTNSSNLPMTGQSLQNGFGGGVDGFVAKFSLDAMNIRYGSYLGGANVDELTSLSPDANGGVVVGGGSASADYPTTPLTAQPTYPATSGSIAGVVSFLIPRVSWTQQMTPSFEVVGGNTTGFQVNTPGPSSVPLRFTLASTNPHLTARPSLTLPAGVVTATAVCNTVGVDSDENGFLQATLYGQTNSSFYVIKAARVDYISTRSSVVGGSTTAATLRIVLDGAAGPSGTTVFLHSNNAAAASIPSSVNIPAGERSAVVPITTSLVAAPASVTFSAFHGSVTETATLSVRPFLPEALTPSAADVTGGTTFQCVLDINAAPTAGGGLNVPITYTGPCSGPATVNIPMGATSVTFDVSTSAVGSGAVARVRATLNGVVRQASVNVLP